MDLIESRHEKVVVVEAVGEIDSRTAHELEKKLVDLLGEGSRLLILDFGKVDQLTSAGLRVMVMIANRLAGVDGKLALASPNAHVKQVLEVSGLSEYFHIVSTKAQAIAELSSTGTLSKVSRLALKLLASGPEGGFRAKRPQATKSAATSKLSVQVAEILSASKNPSRKARGSRAAATGSEDEKRRRK